MAEVGTIGLDTAKRVFQVHGVDTAGAIVFRRQLRRAEMVRSSPSCPPCLVGLEACATAHYRGRQIAALGHRVRLMPPTRVKRYVRWRRENDQTGAQACCEAVSRPSMVFANAGISGATAEAIFEKIVHTNLNGAFFTVNSAAPLMNDNGSIIFSGSVHNYLGQPGVAAYAATKGGLVSMARSIAADLAPRKIRVNVVAPGTTKTPIWKRGPRANATAEESAKVSGFFSSTVPLARWGEPEDVAKAVLFLASDDSSYINAVELMVDGGLTGAPFGAPILRG